MSQVLFLWLLAIFRIRIIYFIARIITSPMGGVAVVGGTIGGGVISHHSVNDLFNDNDHLFKTHGTSFTFESDFDSML